MEERMKNMTPEQQEKFKAKIAEIREKMKDMSPEREKLLWLK